VQGIQRYVVFAFLAGGLLLWATLSKLLSGLFYAVNIADAALIGSNFTLTNLMAFVLAVGGGLYAYKNPIAYEFSSEVVGELKKVTWPSKKETQTATVVVIVTTLLLSVILGVFDAAWASLTGVIYK
jgi:preprotein translocase subunit SecE